LSQACEAAKKAAGAKRVIGVDIQPAKYPLGTDPVSPCTLFCEEVENNCASIYFINSSKNPLDLQKDE
jgi:hypothetical protein